ncbi:type IV pilus secretin PilQ [Thioalkalivibrio sp. XN279]|uniref:type IV pilus secretin PilQ n=1 Tax=Thioalkalivibrio sp. XN279 TaxID=2714953 RepID=UPI00140D9AE0|nr:type IV pilus secretin PilQ [Thioalkalivibrio sp. XN279]NHA13686.1 type IV pilus secretin PilQ [Thioalkalivibrio sp. XN279]
MDTVPARSRRAWWALAAAPLLWLGLSVQAAEGLELTDLEVSTLPGNRVVLTMVTNGPAPEPLSFTIEDPARISLDLPGVTLGSAERRREIKRGVLDTVMLAEAQGRTRVVLNLDVMVPYETRVQGDRIIVTLGEAGRQAVAQAPNSVFGQPSGAAASRSSGDITGIDFRRGADGAGRVIVSLSDPTMSVDIRDELERTVVEFRNASLPDSLLQSLDVLDFATPVETIDSVRFPGGARLVIKVGGEYERLAYQAEDRLNIEFRPVEKQDPTEFGVFDERKEYTGQRLTLNFQDIEVRAVLQLLAEVSGLNVVVSDSVAGSVTLRLDNVPWDQALDIILATKGLDMRQVGNVMLVAPAPEIAARERAELAAKQDIQQLAPLRSEFLQVNYAKASDLAALLSGGQGSASSLLSERGSVSVDERTNTLLVYDTAERISDVRRLVAALDIPVRQVLIESRIVVANDDFSRELGVRMGATYVRENGDDGVISVTGSGQGNDTIVGSANDNLNNTGNAFPVTLPTLDNRYNVNLPVGDAAGRIGLAILGSDYLVDLELSAAQAEGRGEIVSSPRVITANQKEASIEQGVEIPFQESSASGATATQFKQAVLSLTVTPQITPDDRIILDLEVTQDTVGEFVPSGTGGLVPSIDTRRIMTQVLVNDGETVVLGGIFETERRDEETKVPLLGDIPGLGRLFKRTNSVSNKRELLIFVTPKILREGSNIY